MDTSPASASTPASLSRRRRAQGLDTGGTIARQCLDLGLLDEVAVDLVPVVMGEGNRPFFGETSSEDIPLGNPTVCIQGDQVTHLVFPVR